MRLPDFARRWFSVESKPLIIEFRKSLARAAVVFLHGFNGHTSKTWSNFPNLILHEPRLANWDVFALGYDSSLRVDVPGIWAADPDIELLARGLNTTLSLPPLDKYQSIAILSHSMGGLIAQSALLDDELARRVSHLIMFGTPSAGLTKAALGALFKRQSRDMMTDSVFIRSLRASWASKFLNGTSFVLRAVAGTQDEFVPASSSLNPFPRDACDVIAGNHLEIVKPEDAMHPAINLVTKRLCGDGHFPGAVDSANLAIEFKEFQRAVDDLLPRSNALDEAALGSLALALDGLARGEEALRLLEANCQLGSSDAIGILAGRVKRRWLRERSQNDFDRSLELYSRGFSLAEHANDHEQAYYHGINIAFLRVIITPPRSKVPVEVQALARTVLSHCDQSPQTMWRLATEGEAQLFLGELHVAAEKYRDALNLRPAPRQIDSTYQQAVRIAGHIFGESGVSVIEQLFGLPITD